MFPGKCTSALLLLVPLFFILLGHEMNLKPLTQCCGTFSVAVTKGNSPEGQESITTGQKHGDKQQAWQPSTKRRE